MMTNVMVKTCLNQKIIKNSNLIQAMKNNVCSKATVIRRPNFPENRICSLWKIQTESSEVWIEHIFAGHDNRDKCYGENMS